MRTVIVLAFCSLFVMACATPVKPNAELLRLQSSMTLDKANTILQKYIVPTDFRDGLCLMGLNPGARLDYDRETTFRDSKLVFYGMFGDGHLFGKALPLPDVPYGVSTKQVEVDVRQLKEIRVISKNIERLSRWCPDVKPGYLLVLEPRDGLPADAQISINVATPTELNELLAAVSYFSPGARRVGGTGL